MTVRAHLIAGDLRHPVNRELLRSSCWQATEPPSATG
jgi:hypothetical protein